MTQLASGAYFGITREVIQTNDFILSEVAYEPGRVDWHYHHNPFFSFILQGELTEYTPRHTYHCPAGSLLFQHWDDKHWNSGLKPHTGFYVELQKDWFDKTILQADSLQGHFWLAHPRVKILFHQLYKETKTHHSLTLLTMEELISQVFAWLTADWSRATQRPPDWIPALVNMLHDLPDESWSLNALSQQLGIHPGHICRYFKKYVHCTLSEYIRQIKVEHALRLLADTQHSLTEIAYKSGFSDQSHFIRCFKQINRLTPNQFRELILAPCESGSMVGS